MTYEQWYAMVNLRIMELTGKDADQIGEYPFLSDYENEMTTQDAAELFADYVKLMGEAK